MTPEVRGGRLAAIAACGLPAVAWAHAFDERYDLPAPLSWFVWGATAAVALSFVIAAVFLRAHTESPVSDARVLRIGPALSVSRLVARLVSVLLLCAIVAAGYYGTRDPVMNLAPTLVWIVWWVGLTVLVACVGNVWPALDPWRAVFDVLDAAARRLGASSGIAVGVRYPSTLARWPAVVLLLFVGWFEVVYPEGAEPRRLAMAAVTWTMVSLAGMALFGREAWQRNADVFSIYFDVLGRFAPIAAGPDGRSVALRPYGRGLLVEHAASYATVGFVVAMLTIVLFDGLLSGEAWWAAQAQVMRTVPSLKAAGTSFTGAAGLAVLWSLLFAGYAIACAAAAAIAHCRYALLLRAFALSLVPIAIGYTIAHNCSNLLVQGQHLIHLVSDPLGRQWNLFGTAAYRANIGIIDARTTWYVAIGAIVAGHVISVWLAHRVALRELGSRARAIAACTPLTLIMLAYTAISLSIIAEPMVKFDPEAPAESAAARKESGYGSCGVSWGGRFKGVFVEAHRATTHSRPA